MRLHVRPKHLHVFIKTYFFYKHYLQKLKVQNASYQDISHRIERKGLTAKQGT